MSYSKGSEQRILLPQLSWEGFESLVTELGESRSLRLCYYEGQLEMMMPFVEHETANRLFDRMITTIAEELEMPLWLSGSVLLKVPHVKIAKEPSSSYYIHNEAKVRGKKELNYALDPLPDLVLEIDLNKSYFNQMIVYGDLGIKEVWRYDGETLMFYELNHGAYILRNNSPTFDFLTPDIALNYFENCHTQGLIKATQELRHWVQEKLDEE